MRTPKVSEIVRNGPVCLPSGQVILARGNWFLAKVISDKLRSVSTISGPSESGVELLPGIFQGTTKFNEGILECYRKIESDLSSHRSPSYSGLNSCLCDWTFGSSPLNLPLLKAEPFRKSVGLFPMTESFRKSFIEVCDVLLTRVKPASFKIRKKSQSGAPFFVKGEDKAALVYHGLSHARKIVEAYVQKDYNTLQLLHAIGIYTPNTRTQSGSYEYSFSGGRFVVKGKEKKVINPYYSLWQHGFDLEEPDVNVLLDYTSPRPDITGCLVSARSRMIWALNLVVNGLLQPVDAIAQSCLHEFAIARVDSAENMNEELVGFNHRVAWDFSGYDSTNGAECMTLLFDHFYGRFVHKDFLQFMKYVFRSPALLYGFEKGKKDVKVLGSMFNDSLDGGVMSGLALVASAGKIPAICFMVDCLRDFTGADVKTILNNQHEDFRAKVMSDDALVCWRHAKWASQWRQFVDERTSQGKNYFKISWEEYPRFLGPIMEPERPRFDCSKLIETATHSEKSYKFKPYFFYGLAEKLKVYSQEEEFPVIFKHLSDLYKEWGYDLQNIAKYQEVKVDRSGRELEFLQNPDVIYYKYMPDDFPKELVEQYFTTVPEEMIKKFLGGYILV